MKKGMIHIYSGEGHGKTPAALGKALQRACRGENVVIIRFLKGKGMSDSAFVKRLEPEIKIFRFEKSEDDFRYLSEERKAEEISNIRNGLNFAKKVMNTDECDLLILDEILEVLDNGIISVEELKTLMLCKPDGMDVIMTGITLSDEVGMLADEVTRIETVFSKV
ncbi:MAG: cob(I)yrinic acid a,c-diamide adenosyltransferase [Muribaculaceae bacterium]|nr:cob(I)yrinic acid a,c-diamide adenosyltransferase [Muribaculaceae bacterium]